MTKSHALGIRITCIMLILEDDILNRDFFYLDNNTVKWTVDRINADFDDRD
jgi:hypothetical protein